MATTRKKTSGFSAKLEETTEEKEAESFLAAAAAEVLKEEKTPEPLPVVIESIVPTEDVPRFVFTQVEEEEVSAAQAARPQAPAPKVHPPKRHPRNIPKYSRYKQL